jgi:DNA polymerase-3 subunit delta
MPQAIKAPPESGSKTYLLTGEDEFRKISYLDKLKSDIIGKEADAFNYNLYYAKDTTAAEIIRSLQTFSLTGSKRLVVLRDLDAMPDAEKAILAEYISNGFSGNATLVLISSKSSAKTEKFCKRVSGKVQKLTFSKLQADKVVSWIIKEFKRHKKLISGRKAELILESAEQDFGRASSMIEQILLFIGDKENVTDDDIMQFAGIPLESSTFGLLDSINNKDAKKSLIILKNLFQSSSSPVQILGLLTWHITRLIAVKRLLLKKIPRADMFPYLKVGTYMLSRLISQASELTLDRLKKDLQVLLDTDLLIKRSGIKDDFLLEMLVVKLSTK